MSWLGRRFLLLHSETRLVETYLFQSIFILWGHKLLQLSSTAHWSFGCSMLLGEFCASALEHLDIFCTVDNAHHWALELTWLLLLVLLLWFRPSLGGCCSIFSPDLEIHLEVFLYLDQRKFSLCGSPAVLFVLTGNLILVGRRLSGKLILVFEAAFLVLFLVNSSLPFEFCSAQWWVSPFRPRQSSCSLFFSSLVTVFVCFLRILFCLWKVSISCCLLLFRGLLLACCCCLTPKVFKHVW